MRRVLFPAIAFLVCAAPVMAEPGGPPATAAAQSPEATVAEIAAARDEADRLIATAGAQDLFENITGDGRPTVLHRPSGLVCRFERGDPGNAVSIFPSHLPRGDDVGCNIPSDGYSVTHYATRYDEPITAEIAVRDAVASVRQRFGTVREFAGDRLEFSGEGLPQTYLALMEVSYEGRDLYTHAATAEVNGWILKQRLTAPLEEAVNAQIVGAGAWIGALTFAHHRLFDAD